MSSNWQTYLQEHREQYIQELMDFLRIPSISSLPDHAGDVAAAAEWTKTRLRQAGIENARILETTGHPVVTGSWTEAPGAPTILIYGHFDTQPADPVELWTNSPFEPTIRDGRIYARGANDDKGNVLLPIVAIEALLKTEGRLPVNVVFLIEGQEEIGSPDLPKFLAENRDLFKADLVLSADGAQWAEDQPSLWVGLRGLCGLQIDVKGPSTDLHSGSYGGTVLNPIQALAGLLATLHGADGHIEVKGFYDDVRILTAEDRERIARVPFDEDAYKTELGVPMVYGEAGYSTYERTWVRPTLEINGIWGGFQGAGVKTVLPSEAHAKITCRLVGDQKPERILELVTAHVNKHSPEGVTITVTPLPGLASPYHIDPNLPANRVAAQVLRDFYGKEPLYTMAGGTLPVCDLFRHELNAWSIIFAFALEDEKAHSPDEFFRLASFDKGQILWGKLLEAYGKHGVA